jgi:CheY-like chemotaxis protein
MGVPVDDFRDGATALWLLLGKLGYPCRWVGNGPEALAFIRAHPPEQPLLVILDDMMPDMDGVSVLRAMRADPAIAARPAIFHSAGFDLAKREAAISMGALGWFLKGGAGSMDLQTIITRISEIYERVGGAPAHSDDATNKDAAKSDRAAP